MLIKSKAILLYLMVTFSYVSSKVGLCVRVSDTRRSLHKFEVTLDLQHNEAQ